jgi:hypothetical protein
VVNSAIAVTITFSVKITGCARFRRDGDEYAATAFRASTDTATALVTERNEKWLRTIEAAASIWGFGVLPSAAP